MKKKRIQRIGIMVAVLIIALAAIMAIYIGNYYHASKEARDALISTDTVKVSSQEKNQYVFEPLSTEPEAGFIFYPGGKVEMEAYATLMKSLAEHGILCVLVHMPGNLAVFDANAADEIQNQYPEIENWYIGGHSLGGAMAAKYVSKHAKEYKGLVLYASYSLEDLSDSGLHVLSIYGSLDGVLNKKKYNSSKKNLPEGLVEEVIEGGCHSYFGSYGEQKGDGEATTSREEQLIKTVEKTVSFIKE